MKLWFGIPHELWVYTQDDNPKQGQLYQPVRNPLYNYSNYQATVSMMKENSLSSNELNSRDASENSEDLTITIIYDNYLFNKGLETNWGFSCLVEGTEKTILFDTGTKGPMLLRNMGKLELIPRTSIL